MVTVVCVISIATIFTDVTQCEEGLTLKMTKKYDKENCIYKQGKKVTKLYLLRIGVVSPTRGDTLDTGVLTLDLLLLLELSGVV